MNLASRGKAVCSVGFGSSSTTLMTDSVVACLVVHGRQLNFRVIQVVRLLSAVSFPILAELFI